MKKLLILLLLSTSVSAFADSHLDYSLSDFCYQQPNVQDRGFVYYFPNEEVGITAASLCVYKDQYGQYESKGKLKNGKKDGKWTNWYENGQKKSEENYKDGKGDGKQYEWFKNGQIRHEDNYKDGKRDGKWTWWYENGQKYFEINWKDGKKDGKWTTWNKNGQITSEVIYKDGECISGDC